MKIGVELQPFLKAKTGIGIYTYELVKRLQLLEDIELSGNIFNFLDRNDIKPALEGINFPTHTCRLFPYGVYSRTWEHLPFTYNALFREKVDMYHFFNFLVPAKIQGKVITTIHDLTFILYPETMESKNLERLKRNLSYGVERADKIITISESSKRGLIELLKVPEDKIELIYPGVNRHIFSRGYTVLEKQTVKQRYNLPNEYILYIGTLEPRKNIEGLLQAFALLKKEGDKEIQNLKLVLAGKKGWLYDTIFEKIKGLGLEEEIIFTDYVREEDKALIYQMAKVFIFPSLYEGFGIPVLEAMAAGIPVITANNSSLPEVAGDAGILVGSNDYSGMAQAMYNVVVNESLREDMLAKGNRQVQKFEWEQSANRLYELYKKLR